MFFKIELDLANIQVLYEPKDKIALLCLLINLFIPKISIFIKSYLFILIES